jgi:hypothetical protein
MPTRRAFFGALLAAPLAAKAAPQTITVDVRGAMFGKDDGRRLAEAIAPMLPQSVYRPRIGDEFLLTDRGRRIYGGRIDRLAPAAPGLPCHCSPEQDRIASRVRSESRARRLGERDPLDDDLPELQDRFDVRVCALDGVVERPARVAEGIRGEFRV